MQPKYDYRHCKYGNVPLFLASMAFDLQHLADFIHSWSLTIYIYNSEVIDISRELNTSLLNIGLRTETMGALNLNTYKAEDKETLCQFAISANRIIQRLQQLLNICTNNIRNYIASDKPKGISIERMKAQIIISTLFEDDKQLDTIQRITESINIWNQRHDINILPILASNSL